MFNVSFLFPCGCFGTTDHIVPHSMLLQCFVLLSPVVVLGPPSSQIIRSHSYITPHIQCVFAFLLSLFWANPSKTNSHIVPRGRTGCTAYFLFSCRFSGPACNATSEITWFPRVQYCCNASVLVSCRFFWAHPQVNFSHHIGPRSILLQCLCFHLQVKFSDHTVPHVHYCYNDSVIVSFGCFGPTSKSISQIT